MNAARPEPHALAARRVEAISGVVDEAQRIASAARIELLEAQQDLDLRERELAAAKSAHDADDAEAESEVHAEARLRRALRVHERARAKATEANAARDAAIAARAAAALEARKAGLRLAASPAALAAAIEAPWRAILGEAAPGGGSFDALRVSCEALRAADSASVAASEELRTLGIYEPPLDSLHTLLPLLRYLAARDRAIAHLDMVRIPRGPSGLPDLEVPMLAILKSELARPPSPPDHVAAFVARLALVARTRTGSERETLEQREATRPANGSTSSHAQLTDMAVTVETPTTPRTIFGLDLTLLKCGHVSPPRLRMIGGVNLRCECGEWLRR